MSKALFSGDTVPKPVPEVIDMVPESGHGYLELVLFLESANRHVDQLVKNETQSGTRHMG
jgi:hypothetical protein